MAAFNSPVVVAVVVDVPFSAEKQSILTLFDSQGSVGAQKEQVAGLWMGVGLYSMLLWTAGGVLHQHTALN